MKDIILKDFQESIAVLTKAEDQLIESIEKVARTIISAYKDGKKLLIFGNGGSAADSQHMAAELIGRFKKERQAFPALSLTVDTSVITSIGNDYGFDRIFARQIDGLGNAGDIAFGISTSGNSKNVIEAFKIAGNKKLKTIALLGCNGGKIKELADITIIAPSDNTPRIQEVHQMIIHIICNLIEKGMS